MEMLPKASHESGDPRLSGSSFHHPLFQPMPSGPSGPSQMMENNLTYWEPYTGKVLDTNSNVNYHYGPRVAPIPVNDSTKVIDHVRRYIHEIRHFWLETDWKKLYHMVIYDPTTKEIRLVKDKQEYKQQKQNHYDKFREKTHFLKEHIVTKKRLKKLLKHLFRKVSIPTVPSETDKIVYSYVYKKLQKLIEKKINRTH